MLLYLISNKEIIANPEDLMRHKINALKLECDLDLQDINHYLWSLQKENPLLVGGSDIRRVKYIGITVLGVRDKTFYALVDLDHEDLIQVKRDIIINNLTN